MGNAAAAVGMTEAEGGTAAPVQTQSLTGMGMAPASTEVPTRVRDEAGTVHRAAERIAAATSAEVRRLVQSLSMRTRTGEAQDRMAMNGHRNMSGAGVRALAAAAAAAVMIAPEAGVAAGSGPAATGTKTDLATANVPVPAATGTQVPATHRAGMTGDPVLCGSAGSLAQRMAPSSRVHRLAPVAVV